MDLAGREIPRADARQLSAACTWLEERPHTLTRVNSAPGVLCNVPFCEKLSDMERNHRSGNCKPCAYFQDKEDGCRKGEDCTFCHICLPGELKKRKQAKKR